MTDRPWTVPPGARRSGRARRRSIQALVAARAQYVRSLHGTPSARRYRPRNALRTLDRGLVRRGALRRHRPMTSSCAREADDAGARSCRYVRGLSARRLGGILAALRKAFPGLLLSAATLALDRRRGRYRRRAFGGSVRAALLGVRRNRVGDRRCVSPASQDPRSARFRTPTCAHRARVRGVGAARSTAHRAAHGSQRRRARRVRRAEHAHLGARRRARLRPARNRRYDGRRLALRRPGVALDRRRRRNADGRRRADRRRLAPFALDPRVRTGPSLAGAIDESAPHYRLLRSSLLALAVLGVVAVLRLPLRSVVQPRACYSCGRTGRAQPSLRRAS